MNAKPMLALTAALWLGIGLSACSDGDDENTEQNETTSAQSQSTDDEATSVEDSGEEESRSEPMSEADRQATLEDSLRANFDPQLGEVRYLVGWADLNGDDQQEAVVHVVGPMVCGTGGCDTLILQAQDNAWQVISAQPTTEPPVQLANSAHDGWQDLLMQRHVGADEPSETVRLRFDGSSYVEAEGDTTGAEPTTTLIEPFDSLDDAQPLFEGDIDGSYENADLVDEQEAATAAEPENAGDEASDDGESSDNGESSDATGSDGNTQQNAGGENETSGDTAEDEATDSSY